METSLSLNTENLLKILYAEVGRKAPMTRLKLFIGKIVQTLIKMLGHNLVIFQGPHTVFYKHFLLCCGLAFRGSGSLIQECKEVFIAQPSSASYIALRTGYLRFLLNPLEPRVQK